MINYFIRPKEKCLIVNCLWKIISPLSFERSFSSYELQHKFLHFLADPHAPRDMRNVYEGRVCCTCIVYVLDTAAGLKREVSVFAITVSRL